MGGYRESIPTEKSNHWFTLIQEQFHPSKGKVASVNQQRVTLKVHAGQ